MKCLDCKDVEMEIESVDSTKSRDIFEVVWKCLKCGEVFFATIYRKEGGESK
jgi:RNase P subunit RPR2